jgi:hypothetical protein
MLQFCLFFTAVKPADNIVNGCPAVSASMVLPDAAAIASAVTGPARRQLADHAADILIMLFGKLRTTQVEDG